MKAQSFSTKKCLMGYALVCLCHSLCVQGQSVFHALSPENNTLQLRTNITSSDTISLDGLGSIYSFSIDATIHQPQEASFARIVLEDKDGHDYLVAESDWFRFDTTTVSLNHYCEETAILNGITPSCLKCYVTGGVTVALRGIYSSDQIDTRNIDRFAETTKRIKDEQVKDIVSRINSYNTKYGRLWRAAVTEISLLHYNEKKCFEEAGNGDSYLNNIQYYSGGLFEVGTPRAYTDTIVSPYVPSFDWRNRHGKCWLTPAKKQRNSQYCTAFAAVGMLESNLLLHYKYEENDTSAIDLSEQYVASYGGVSYTGGGSNSQVVRFLKTDGTIDDASMPFVNNANYTPPAIRPEGNEHVYLYDYDMIDLINIPTPIDTIKKYLIQRGPGVCGYQTATPYTHNRIGGHAMTLAGYGTIAPNTAYSFFYGISPNVQPDTIFHEGDSIIGHTYWIYKQSRGPSWGHNGYLYIIYYNDDPWYMNKEAYFPKGRPRSNVSRPILCEDLDGDGYVNRGIDLIPPDIAVWAQSDGDDSDPTIGHMNEYGYCEQLSANHPTYEYIYNDSTLTTFVSNSNYIGVLRGAMVTLQTQPNYANGTKILLDYDATLVIDGFTVNFDFLQPYPGSKIVLINGAKIQKPFATPLGVKFVINNGSIE